MNKFLLIGAVLSGLVLGAAVRADEIDKNTAQMQAMDKITGRVSKIKVPVGGEVKFGSLSIVVRSCKTRPEEETPDNFAFADITDKTLQGEVVNIFRGWMISSSPATHAVEHPIYDVWLLKCLDAEIDKTLLLSEEELAEREKLVAPEETVTADNLQSAEGLSQKPIAEMQDEAHEQTEPIVDMNATEFSYDEEDVPEVDDAVTGENEGGQAGKDGFSKTE